MSEIGTEAYGDVGAEKRVLVAGLYHQTNTFVGGRTGLDNFEIRRGQEMLQTETDDAYPVAGVLRVAQQRGWHVLPVVEMRALPGPTVADAVVDLFWAEFQAVADRELGGGIDGVFLVVHGAMVSDSWSDVEGEILRRIRGIEHLSDAPVCGVMDPLANFTEAMGRQSDGLIAHRGSPPSDSREAADLAADTLDGLMLAEDRPATVWDHPPIMWPPSLAATGGGPIVALKGRARQIEAEVPDVLAVNVLAGFPYADVPEAGVSFSAVTTGDLELARGALRELNVLASSLREAGTPRLTSLEDAMDRLEDHREGPVLLVEPSDDAEAGAAGDATRVLRALAEREVPDAGVVINDPETVAALADVRSGEHRDVEIGGKSGQLGSEPLSLAVEVVSKSDGRFDRENGAGRSGGGEVRVGPCAVVRHGGITVLLTSERVLPPDPGQWRSQDIEPEDMFVIAVKSSAEHGGAYGSMARASYALDLPGPCAPDLRRLPFENVTRPVYPLDPL